MFNQEPAEYQYGRKLKLLTWEHRVCTSVAKGRECSGYMYQVCVRYDAYPRILGEVGKQSIDGATNHFSQGCRAAV